MLLLPAGASPFVDEWGEVWIGPMAVTHGYARFCGINADGLRLWCLCRRLPLPEWEPMPIDHYRRFLTMHHADAETRR